MLPLAAPWPLWAQWGGNVYYLPSCCGKTVRVSAKRVLGKLKLSQACGAKCLASKGPNCECACGGHNHGMGWSATV